MVITIKKPDGKTKWTQDLCHWVKKYYHPQTTLKNYDTEEIKEDLSTVIFELDGKFYGPVRQSLMPRHCWQNISKFMAARKNSRKQSVKSDFRYSSDYKSRFVLLDPDQTFEPGWWNK